MHRLRADVEDREQVQAVQLRCELKPDLFGVGIQLVRQLRTLVGARGLGRWTRRSSAGGALKQARIWQNFRPRSKIFWTLLLDTAPAQRRKFPHRVWREMPIYWRSIARQALGLGRNAPSMKPDDWLIWISLVWFVGLCAAAASLPWPS